MWINHNVYNWMNQINQGKVNGGNSGPMEGVSMAVIPIEL